LISGVVVVVVAIPISLIQLTKVIIAGNISVKPKKPSSWQIGPVF
jgi:hypothetical protein